MDFTTSEKVILPNTNVELRLVHADDSFRLIGKKKANTRYYTEFQSIELHLTRYVLRSELVSTIERRLSEGESICASEDSALECHCRCVSSRSRNQKNGNLRRHVHSHRLEHLSPDAEHQSTTPFGFDFPPTPSAKFLLRNESVQLSTFWNFEREFQNDFSV